MQHHTTQGNIYWSFNVFMSFSLHFCNTLTDDSCVSSFFRLKSSNISRASQAGRVYRLTLRICRVLLHFPHSEGSRRYSRLKCILTAWLSRMCTLTAISIIMRLCHLTTWCYTHNDWLAGHVSHFLIFLSVSCGSSPTLRLFPDTLLSLLILL